MPRQVGDAIGPYVLEALLGAGGMGQVWRARDTRLDRPVAIKFSQQQFSERFAGEARAIAQLTHPHIAAVYDVGPDYLVMELVEGTPLQGPMPWRDAARAMADVCDALDTAHRRGLVHRDLKPANVLHGPQGVKVIDFGLARRMATDVESTMTRITAPGIVMGTVAYMAPEQAADQVIDGRADLWAAGLMIYELVTGRLPFASTSATPMLAEIMDPSPLELEMPVGVPAEFARITRKLVAKDPAERYQHADEVALDLRALVRDSAARTQTQTGTLAPAAGGIGKAWAWITAGLGLVAVAASALALALWLQPAPPARSVVRFRVETPPLALRLHPPAPVLALSPDGTRLAYVAETSEPSRDASIAARGQLFLRHLEDVSSTPVTAAPAASSPFFSFDGRWLGFESDGKLRKIAVDGGPPLTICDAPDLHGAVWLEDGTIVFGMINGLGGAQIARVAETGGQPERLATADVSREAFLVHPSATPDGSLVFFTSVNVTGEPVSVSALDLRTRERQVIEGVIGDNVQYLATGDLLSVRDGALWVVPFDLAAVKVKGPAVKVLEGLAGGAMREPGMGHVAASTSGSLAYVVGPWSRDLTAMQAFWVTPDGAEEPLAGLSGVALGGPRVSPDGSRIAVRSRASGREPMQVWLYDVARQTLGRLTLDGENWWPVWLPDGSRVAFPHVRDDAQHTDVVAVAAGGSGAAEVILSRRESCQPYSSQADRVYMHCQSPTESGLDWDIWVASRNGGAGTSQAFLSTRFDEMQPAVSPDGRHLAYVSQQSGLHEIYLQSTSGDDSRVQVSSSGGLEPLWAPDGRTLFYRQWRTAKSSALSQGTEPAPGAVLAVTVGEGSPPRLSSPRMLFSDPYAGRMMYGRDWDITPDGRHFVMIRSQDLTTPPSGITVVLNWLDELRH